MIIPADQLLLLQISALAMVTGGLALAIAGTMKPEREIRVTFLTVAGIAFAAAGVLRFAVWTM